MIEEQDYLAHDATALAELVARRELSASELLEAAIARAESENPRLNAIVSSYHARAQLRARGSLTGPFAGVPFLLKDLFQAYQGLPSSWGNAARKQAAIPAAEHDEITKRYLAAGVVPFGNTNVPEFGAKGATEPDAFGAALNPWNTDHTPGGSSGGAAAAVAAGIVPFAGANDGGGSIRIPAAYCGLFGLKPGRGRTPNGPMRQEAIHGAGVQHVLARSVRDSARMLDACHGPELGSWTVLAAPELPYADACSRDPRPLRIAFSTRSPLGHSVDPEAITAVENAARLLESLGHHMESNEPELDGAQLARDFLQVWFANCALMVEQTRALTGSSSEGFEVDTLAMAAMGRALRATDYIANYERWNVYLRQLAIFHTRYDLYLTPTVACPAPAIGSVKTPAVLGAMVRGLWRTGMSDMIALARKKFDEIAYENLRMVPFTQLANLTGVPAMSVPLHVSAAGLPIGVQFVAAHGDEGLLFSLAGQLERAAPWAARYPFSN